MKKKIIQRRCEKSFFRNAYKLRRTLPEIEISVLYLDGTYRIDFLRNKQRGGKIRLPSYALIEGHLECAALDRYIECFPKVPIVTSNGLLNGRIGKFFRYLSKDLVSTTNVIGIHICEKIGIKIATLLGLPNP